LRYLRYLRCKEVLPLCRAMYPVFEIFLIKLGVENEAGERKGVATISLSLLHLPAMPTE